METFKQGIARFWNYENADIAKADKIAKYICSDERTNADLIFSHILNANNVSESFEIIYKRWQPKGTRVFKHGVFSFGKSDLSPEKAVDITKEMLEQYRSFPWLAAVHTNRVGRVHSHFLLGCVNLNNGHKFSQGPKDLKAFRDFYNMVAEKYSLPLLRGSLLSALPDKPKALQSKVNSFGEKQEDEESNYGIMPMSHIETSPQVYYEKNVNIPQTVSAIVEPFVETIREDMAKWFSIGYRGISNGRK